jgi:hypothetical protein
VQGSGGRRAEVRPVAKRTGQAFSSTAPVPLFLEGWRDNSRLVGNSETTCRSPFNSATRTKRHFAQSDPLPNLLPN